MIYEKQNFIDYPLEGYTTLKAEHLNHIEDGIEQTAALFPTMTSNDFGKQLFVNETGDGFLLLGNTTTVKWENLIELAEMSRPGYLAGKGVTQSGTGNIVYQAPSSFYTYINIPIQENVKYYFGGPNSSGNYARFINWQSAPYTGLSASGQITTMTNEEIDAITISMIGGTGAREGWISPRGTKFCTVSFYDLSQGGIENNYVTTIEDPELRKDKVVNNSIEVVNSGKWNLVEEAELGYRNWFDAKKRNGNYQAGGFYTYYNIPVIGGTTYYLGPVFNGQYARFINWSTDKYIVNSSGTVNMDSSAINAITRDSFAATTNEAHKAPLGAKYCTVTFYVGYGEIVVDDCYFTVIEEPENRIDGLPTYRVSTQGVSQELIEQINENTENIQKLDSEISLSNSKKLVNCIQKTRNTVINFQFDDAVVAGDTICKQIFDEFGYKCDFAITSTASTKFGTYLDFQKEGFHILSHSTDGAGMGSVTDEADKQAKINKMKQSYDILVNSGFDIHGWVTPSSSLHTSLYPAVAEIYDYGFGTGQSTSVYHVFGEERYLAHMSRVGIESNLILKTDTNPTAQNKVITYMQTLWGNATPDEDYQLVIISDSSFDSLVNNAIMDGYEGVAASDGVINEMGVRYLKEIWGVSVEDSTLVIDANNSVISLTPTFKICCEREGMKNIRNYIDTAIEKKAFLSFYAHNTYSEDNTENGYGINLSKYTREILQYCQRVGVKVLNAADAIQEYFSFRYTDFIELQDRLS